ncbi:unnamed protein product [Caenorhabditis angaria]|uniref:Receptor L-domain domain-containing protein n=1 Tax=Caenorhabditis angaria TaxID=860376 RepID=A0A9P1IE30_9PELO|nr:unnamed protein product [Caenorhabditis angaria]
MKPIAILFVVLVYKSINAENASCEPSEFEDGNDNCMIIEGGVLELKGESKDDFDTEKLKKITEIRHGLHVKIDDLEIFDLLPNVKRIANPNGNALHFSNHKNLKTIKFESLEQLSGKVGIYFENDKFPSFTDTEETSMNSLSKLNQVFVPKHIKCKDNFIRVFYSGQEENSEEPANFWLYIIIVACIIVLLAIILFVVQIFKCQKMLKNLDAKKTKDAEEQSSNEDPGARSPNAGRKVKSY